MYNSNNNYGFPVEYCTDTSNANFGSNVANITTIIARSVLKYALGDTPLGDLEGSGLLFWHHFCKTFRYELYLNRQK